MSKIAVLGAGMMGSAICVPIADCGHDVRLVGTFLDEDIVTELKSSGVHPGLAHQLPQSVRAFSIDELGDAMSGVDVIVLGVSSPGVRWAAETIAPYVGPHVPILMITKGLEWNGDELVILPDVLRDALPRHVRDQVSPTAVAGPCIAGELAQRAETCVVFTGRDCYTLSRLAQLVRTSYYHIWTSTDIVGVEVCAALKNAFAMAIGFGAGLHERRGGKPGSVAMHNYEAAVFAQAVGEMAHLVDLAGGEASSSYGLAGMGDLQVTCNGGRTGRLGRWFGLGLKLEQAVEKMAGATLECLDIIRVLAEAIPALEAAGRLGPDDIPLCRHLCEIVIERTQAQVPFDSFFNNS